jgi:hypothetical protein
MNASRGSSEMKTAIAYSSRETGRQRDSQGATGSVRREKQLQYKESRSNRALRPQVRYGQGMRL